ncbi:fimbrial protein [Parabacteroides goldsteinii]|uniref:fimbrial protein n=1 Tax=Parabacteroides goldsteinii TaxID=328812 RepID=UPI0032B232C8
MNAKNIISAILMVLSFAACSSDIEGFDDNMTNNNTNNGETSISVRMVMEGVSTKAGTTIDLTTEEAAIKNYVIAVFEEKSGERVGYASGTANGSYLVTPIVKGIDAKAGIVKVIVVANIDDINDFNNLYTYEEFSTKTVGHLNNWTKVGIEDNVTLFKTDNELNIELKQLTARVNVTLNEPTVTGGNNVTVTFRAYHYTASIAESSKIVYVPQTADTRDILLDTNGETSFSYITYSVASPKLEVYAKLEIIADGIVKNTIEKEIPVSFISKDNGKLDALIAGKSYDQQVYANVTISQNFDVDFSYEIADITDNENQDITFN